MRADIREHVECPGGLDAFDAVDRAESLCYVGAAFLELLAHLFDDFIGLRVGVCGQCSGLGEADGICGLVAIGDPFANIAFDPAQQPVFVVEGRFDLSGMGRLTETGTQEVISLIKRSGGKIASKLTVDVDFVVMGPEPSKPAKLPEDSPPTAKKAWEIRMEEYNRWRKTLDKAIALNVPKLNTRRFLTLTGYETAREYEN